MRLLPRLQPLPAAQGVIALGTLAYALLGAWSLALILTGRKVPVSGSDTCSYLIMADQPWLESQFYSGIHPPTVPGLWSFFSGGHDQTGIIAFQTCLHLLAWACFAWTAAGLFRSRAFGAAGCLLILAYSLGGEVQASASRLLSESISQSLLVATLAALILFYRVPSWPRMAGVVAVAAPFAFSRDTNAYLLLATAGGMIALEAWKARGPQHAFLPAPATPALAIACGFILCFAASTWSASRVAVAERDYCYGRSHPMVEHRLFHRLETRHLFPLLNVIGQRILPYGFRLRHFEERGLPVNESLRGKAFHWASQGTDSTGRSVPNWEWYWKDSLQPARSWLARHGKGAYAEYLLLHPRYAFIRPWGELRPIYASQSNFQEGFAFPVLAWLRPPFHFAFGPGRPLVLMILAGMAACLVMRPSPVGRTGEAWTTVALPAACILLCAAAALFIYHGDSMDVARHSIGNRVALDLATMLWALLLCDRLRPSRPVSPRNRGA